MNSPSWTQELRNIADLAAAYNLPEPVGHQRYAGGTFAIVVLDDDDLHKWETALAETVDITAIEGYLVLMGMAADTIVKVTTQADIDAHHEATVPGLVVTL